MSISISEYKEMSYGQRVSFNNDVFEVTQSDSKDDESDHILINIKTGDRLYGAIYITHLIDFAGVNNSPVKIASKDTAPLNEGIKATPSQDDSSSTETLRIFDLLSSMSIDQLGYPDYDLFYLAETITGRTSYGDLNHHRSSIEKYLLKN